MVKIQFFFKKKTKKQKKNCKTSRIIMFFFLPLIYIYVCMYVCMYVLLSYQLGLDAWQELTYDIFNITPSNSRWKSDEILSLECKLVKALKMIMSDWIEMQNVLRIMFNKWCKMLVMVVNNKDMNDWWWLQRPNNSFTSDQIMLAMVGGWLH